MMELSLVILALTVASLTIWSIRAFVADAILRARVAEELVHMIAANPAAIDALGHRIRRAGPATGGVHRIDGAIRTVLAIPIAGSNGEGIAYVNALREAGCWSFASLTIHFARSVLRLDTVPPRLRSVRASRPLPPRLNRINPKEIL